MPRICCALIKRAAAWIAQQSKFFLHSVSYKQCGVVLLSIQEVLFIVNSYLITVFMNELNGHYRKTQISKRQHSVTPAAAAVVLSAPPTATVSTNTISVVAAALLLKLLTTWNVQPSGETGVGAGPLPASWVPTDLTTVLPIFPGETREEQLSLQVQGVQALCRYFDELSCETHFRVTVREYCKGTTPGATKPVTCTIMDYTGPMGSVDGGANTSTSSSTSCTLMSHVHNSVPCRPSHESGATNSTNFLTNLSLFFRPSADVMALDVEIEVCSAPKRVMDAVRCFRSAVPVVSSHTASDVASTTTSSSADANAAAAADDNTEERDRLAGDVDPSQLTLYSRCYTARLLIQRTAGLSAAPLAPLPSAVMLPVPSYESSRLRSALDCLLGASAALRKDLATRSRDSMLPVSLSANVKIVPEKLGILLEVILWCFLLI